LIVAITIASMQGICSQIGSKGKFQSDLLFRLNSGSRSTEPISDILRDHLGGSHSTRLFKGGVDPRHRDQQCHKYLPKCNMYMHPQISRNLLIWAHIVDHFHIVEDLSHDDVEFMKANKLSHDDVEFMKANKLIWIDGSQVPQAINFLDTSQLCCAQCTVNNPPR
jgi:hypothetical protein